jgi:isoquinoline 1-oxidoreductase alpha subunit
MATTLKINGEQKSFDAPADMPLLWVLRDVLGMTGTKFGCRLALRACTVHVDGKPVRSCMLPVGAVRDRAVTTIEASALPGRRKVQKARLDLEVVQCGYCHRARSCRPPPCSRARPIPMIPTSTPRWRKYLPLRHLCAHSRRDQARRLPASVVGGDHGSRGKISDGLSRRVC